MHTLNVDCDFGSFRFNELELVLLLAIQPQALCHIHVCHDFGPLTVLVSVLPHTVVCTSIGPHVYTEAVFFVELVLALVASTILPMVQALSMHLSIDPFALVARLAICMDELALPVE